MKLRRIVSLFLLLGTILLLVTSVILYIMPHGRVAYWAGWTTWGLSKDQWSNLHMNLGLLLMVAAVFHAVYNWRPIVNYLSSPETRKVVFNRNMAVAAGIAVVVLAGTLAEAPPLRWIPDLNATVKDAAAERYGEPPYGHAELSPLKVLARRQEIDPEGAVARLREAGYVDVDAETNLLTIGRANGVTPQVLFDVMMGGAGRGGAAEAGLPHAPGSGMGRMRLEDLCARYGVDPADALRRLDAAGIEAQPGWKLKDIAERNRTTPGEVYRLLQPR